MAYYPGIAADLKHCLQRSQLMQDSSGLDMELAEQHDFVQRRSTEVQLVEARANMVRPVARGLQLYLPHRSVPTDLSRHSFADVASKGSRAPSSRSVSSKCSTSSTTVSRLRIRRRGRSQRYAGMSTANVPTTPVMMPKRSTPSASMGENTRWVSSARLGHWRVSPTPLYPSDLWAGVPKILPNVTDPCQAAAHRFLHRTRVTCRWWRCAGRWQLRDGNPGSGCGPLAAERRETAAVSFGRPAVGVNEMGDSSTHGHVMLMS
jgi:hypothetical protein